MRGGRITLTTKKGERRERWNQNRRGLEFCSGITEELSLLGGRVKQETMGEHYEGRLDEVL